LRLEVEGGVDPPLRVRHALVTGGGRDLVLVVGGEVGDAGDHLSRDGLLA
jgi:hypothetical protein